MINSLRVIIKVELGQTLRNHLSKMRQRWMTVRNQHGGNQIMLNSWIGLFNQKKEQRSLIDIKTCQVNWSFTMNQKYLKKTENFGNNSQILKRTMKE